MAIMKYVFFGPYETIGKHSLAQQNKQHYT